MYNTVNELTQAIKTIIDAHWRLEKSEEDLVKEITGIFGESKHCAIALRGKSFSATFEQRLGKKRTKFLKDVLNQIDPQKFRFS